jgi:hypothetical protein
MISGAGHERAERLTSEQLDAELIAEIAAQLAHLSGQYGAENDSEEALALDRALDAWDSFIAARSGRPGAGR